MTPEKLAAFIDYVCRPIIEDIKVILDKLETLAPGIDKATIQWAVRNLILTHIAGEVIRAITAVTIGALVCRAAVLILIP